MALWTPQPGPQARAVVCPADLILYGGARGGGKTDCSIGRQIIKAERYGRLHQGMMIRRKYKDFGQIRRRWDALILDGLPAERIGGETQVNYVRFANGSVVKLQAFEHANMLDDEQGNEYTEISVDDAGTIPYLAAMVMKLRGVLRSPHNILCQMFLTANPGGPAHSYLKSAFIDKGAPCRPHIDEHGFSRVFINADLDDNPILDLGNPKYRRNLESLEDAVLRRAWLEGDWTAFAGQAFPLNEAHIIQPLPIPRDAPVMMTYDWGFGKPFSIGWWWFDHDGRAYRFAEWYGWNGVPDEGIRLSDSEIVMTVKQKEAELGIGDRVSMRYAGHDCFAKRPDYRGGGQGPSTADVWAQAGIYLKPADATRNLKIRQFRERLRVKRDAEGKLIERPMMLIYNTCEQFIRTVQGITMDPDNPEDIDTDLEDHPYDEAAQMAMARPLNVQNLEAHMATPEKGAKKGKLYE